MRALEREVTVTHAPAFGSGHGRRTGPDHDHAPAVLRELTDVARLVGLAHGNLFWAGSAASDRWAAWMAEHGPRAYRDLEDAMVRLNRLALRLARDRLYEDELAGGPAMTRSGQRAAGLPPEGARARLYWGHVVRCPECRPGMGFLCRVGVELHNTWREAA